MQDAPSANRLRKVLAQALPERAKLQQALNRSLRAQTSRFVKRGKRSYYVAIDLTLIPYHGEWYTDEKEIVRSQAKSGTTHFHGYATVSIVHNHQRYVLALRFVEKGESMDTIVKWLLSRIKSTGISMRYAYLDKGFCSAEVLNTLKRRKIRYVMPVQRAASQAAYARRFKSWAVIVRPIRLTAPSMDRRGLTTGYSQRPKEDCALVVRVFCGCVWTLPQP